MYSVLAESGSKEEHKIAAGMEDDYLPLYEVVDHANKDNPNGIANNSGYERLINDANSVQEEYQLPQSDTSYVRYPAYSETATEIQELKRNSRYLKMIFLIGGVVIFMILMITVCIFAGIWIRFGRNLAHVQKSLIKEMDNVNMHGDLYPKNDQGNLSERINHVQRTLTEQIDVLNEAYHALVFSQERFRNCSQENTTCNFKYYSSNSRTWLYCDTPTLQTNERVRLIPFLHTKL